MKKNYEILPEKEIDNARLEVFSDSIVDLCCGKGHEARRIERHKQAIQTIKDEYKDKIPKAVYDRIMQSAKKEGAE